MGGIDQKSKRLSVSKERMGWIGERGRRKHHRSGRLEFRIYKMKER